MKNTAIQGVDMPRLIGIVFSGLLFLSISTVSAQVRTWTDRSGDFEIEATMLDCDGKDVKLKKKSDGKVVTIPLQKLSLEDRAYVKKTMDTLDGDDSTSKNRSSAERPNERSAKATGNDDESDDNTDESEPTVSKDGSFKGEFTKVNVNFARQISEPNGKTSWSIAPDPAPVTQLNFKPVPLTFNPGNLKSRPFVDLQELFFSISNPEKVLTALTLSERGVKATVVVLVDVKTGVVKQKIWPANLRVLGISPNGTRGLFIQMEKNESFGKGFYLTIADLTAPKFDCIKVLVPFPKASGRDPADKIEGGGWIDDDHVYICSDDRKLLVLQVEKARAVWSFETSMFNTTTLSPGNKYMVVGSRRKGHYLFEAKTGKPIGMLDHSQDFVNVSAFAFSTDGTKLAAFENGWIYCWRVVDGKCTCSFYIGGNEHKPLFAWLGDKYLLLGKRLIEMEQYLPIWRYSDATDASEYFAGIYWRYDNDYNEKTVSLTPFKLPHAGLPTLPKLSDEKKYCIRPGISVKLDIDPSIPDNQQVREHFLKVLAEKNITVSDNASITLAARLKQGETLTRRIMVIGGPQSGDHTVTYPTYNASYGFEENGQNLWTKGTMMGPAVTSKDYENKSIEQAYIDNAKPSSRWFLAFECPDRIPHDKMGASTLGGKD